MPDPINEAIWQFVQNFDPTKAAVKERVDTHDGRIELSTVPGYGVCAVELHDRTNGQSTATFVDADHLTRLAEAALRLRDQMRRRKPHVQPPP